MVFERDCKGLIMKIRNSLVKFVNVALILCAACLIYFIFYALFRARRLILYAADVPFAGFIGIVVALGLIVSLMLYLNKRTFHTSKVRVSSAVISVFFMIIFVITPITAIIIVERTYFPGEIDLNKLNRLYDTREEWETRVTTIRQGILTGAELVPLPNRTPLNPVIHSNRTYNGYSVANVYFESLPGFFVTANLYQPLNPNPNSLYPIILLPHGHFNNNRFESYNQNLAATFARMGAMAIIYDMVGRGESTQMNHDNDHTLALQTWNSIRVIDFMLSLPNADPNRIGVTGASGGGTQTFLLSAVDPRVNVSAPVVMVSAFSFGGCSCESGMPIYRGDNYSTNHAEIAAMIAPKPLLLISCGHDWTRETPTSEYPFIQRIYGFYNQTEKVANAHFPDEYHGYTVPMRNASYWFFGQYLSLNIDAACGSDGQINESLNTIEEIDTMRAFSATHPRPSYALLGQDAILVEMRKQQNLTN